MKEMLILSGVTTPIGCFGEASGWALLRCALETEWDFPLLSSGADCGQVSAQSRSVCTSANHIAPRLPWHRSGVVTVPMGLKRREC